jgi:hypothetical protein
MAKLPTIKKINSEDFPDQKWINKLTAPLNSFMEQVVDALNGNLNINDNLSGEVKTITVDSMPFSFKWKKKIRPVHLTVGWCDQTLTDAPHINWTYSDGMIRINSITGITPALDIKYQLTLQIITG